MKLSVLVALMLLPSVANTSGEVIDLSNLIDTTATNGTGRFWIGPRCSKMTFVDAMFLVRGWKQVDKADDATLVWPPYGMLGEDKHRWLKKAPLIVNYLSTDMTSKSLLRRLLIDTGASYVQPPTHEIADADDCADFLTNHAQECHRWLTKEAALSNGYGIQIWPEIDAFKTDVGFDGKVCTGFDEHRRKKIEELAEVSSEDVDEDPYLMQCHIDRPFLVEKKKTEVRFFWMVASLDPYIVLLYKDGWLRLSTEDYVHDDWDNKNRHLGNRKFQTDHPDFKAKSANLKRSSKELEDVLRASGRINSAPGVWHAQLQEVVRQALIEVSHASLEHLLERNHPTRHFSLFGVDGILEDLQGESGAEVPGGSSGPSSKLVLDGGLKYWLTEIQAGPAMARNSQVERVVMPQMVLDVANVALEVDYRKEHGLPLDVLHSAAERFLVIIGPKDAMKMDEL